MQSAKASLDVAVFDLNLDAVVQVLVASFKDIPVRVVVDRRQAKGAKSLVLELVRAGVPVRYGKQAGIMHNKFAIVDGKWLETGSFNYTKGAATKNNENQIYLDTHAIVQQYQARFDLLWEASTPAK